MTKRWWSIGSIRFSKPQMWWLIENLAELKQGRWPQKPEGYTEEPHLKIGCQKAKDRHYYGNCFDCPFKPCLNPSERTPMRVRKEPSQNKVLEIAAEVEIRLGLVMDYISGWPRPRKKIKRRKRISKKI